MIAFVVIIGLIFLHYTRVLTPVESFVSASTQAVSGKAYQVSAFVKNTYNKQVQTRDQSQKIAELKGEVNRLTAEIADLRTAQEENQKLREYLDFFEGRNYDHILANVVSRGVSIDPQEKNAHIVIDKGKKQGVESGLLVVNEEGVVVGKIGSVRPESSELILITNNGSQVACSVQNSDRTSGVVEGRLGLTMEMNFIPQSEEVKEGDLVVTSGLERSIPKGLAVGKVAEVNSSKNDVWQQATVEPLVDFDNLTVVSVLVP